MKVGQKDSGSLQAGEFADVMVFDRRLPELPLSDSRIVT